MMSFIRMVVIALALASTSSSFHPSESVRNQYETSDALTKATDHSLERENSQVLDLQVGCGDSNIHEGRQEDKSSRSNRKKSRIPSRRKRSYVPWSGQVTYSVPYQSINIWKPPVYALERPYFVPIYGVAGKPPIYFPPQPLLHNPGVPKDNPQKFQGPQYLPPDSPSTTEMSTFDRFNPEDNYDDRPVWDLGSEEQATRPPSVAGIIPTRAPRPPPEAITPPPLIHNPTDNGGGSTSSSSGTRPGLNQVENQPFVPPPRQPPMSTTTSRPNEPTRCVWAIISCCSNTKEIRYDCFEERGCPGAFWDSSPCDSEFAKAAIAAALNYYN